MASGVSEKDEQSGLDQETVEAFVEEYKLAVDEGREFMVVKGVVISTQFAKHVVDRYTGE